MPETGAVIGTPASISASVEPQTEPIDDEPFDSSVSETMRIVYGNVLGRSGCTASSARCASAPWPMSRRFGRAHAARLPDRVGREVVVVHVAAVTLEREVVDALPLLRRAERQQRHDLRLAAGEEARAVGARHDRHLDLDRADLRRSPAVRPTLVDRDLLADEALVDRLARLLDVALRQRVLDGRLAVDGRRRRPGTAARRSRRSARRAGCRFADLSSFESCSASVSPRSSFSNCSRTTASTATERCFSRIWASDMRTCSSPKTSPRRRPSTACADFLLDDLLDDRSRLAEAVLLDALPDRWPYVALEPLGDGRVEPLRLARPSRAAPPAPRRASRSRA